jgi:hypothetical protein
MRYGSRMMQRSVTGMHDTFGELLLLLLLLVMMLLRSL